MVERQALGWFVLVLAIFKAFFSKNVEMQRLYWKLVAAVVILFLIEDPIRNMKTLEVGAGSVLGAMGDIATIIGTAIDWVLRQIR